MFSISITAFEQSASIEEVYAKIDANRGLAVVLGPAQAKLVSIGDLVRARGEGRKIVEEVEGTPIPFTDPVVEAQDLTSNCPGGILDTEVRNHTSPHSQRPSLLLTFYTCNKNFSHWYTPQQFMALSKDQAGNRLCSNQDGGIVS